MRSMVRNAAAALLLCCTALAGCHRNPPPIWRSDLLSPDGKWVATAYTLQKGGFGTGRIDTYVALRGRREAAEAGTPSNVLAFRCYGPAKRPFTPSEENEGGTIHLRMHWIDATHLDVTYDGRAQVELETSRFAGISVSLAVQP